MADEEKKTDDDATDADKAKETRTRYESTAETIGPCKVEVTITVPVETINEELDERYAEIIKTVAFPGFRLGHAPRRLVEKRLGDEVAGDVKEHIVTESFKAAMETHELDPLSEPDVDLAGLEFDPETPLSYTATVITRPVVELPDYGTITVSAVKPEIDATQVDEAIEDMRKQHAVLEPAEGGKMQEGDVAVMDYVARVGDEKIHDGENVEYTHPAAFVGGFPVKGLAEEILGKGSGDEITLTQDLPDTWPDPDLAGAEMTVTLKIHDVKRHVLPDLDEDFVKGLDYDSVEELREEVEDQVRRHAEEQAREATNRALIDAVIAAAPFELPEDVIQQETSERIDRIQATLRMRGAGEEEVEEKLAEARADAREDVERDFRAAFLMDAISKAEKIFVTEREVDERVAQMAAAYHRTPEEMEQYLEQRGLASQIRSGMREEKVVELLRKKVKIEGAE